VGRNNLKIMPVGMESVFYGFENENIMTKEQHQEFIEFALELKWNRDAYSRARIIEELMDKVDELVKHCSIPNVSNCDAIFEQDAKLTQEEIEEDCRNMPN
jgi:hypothetical protein